MKIGFLVKAIKMCPAVMLAHNRTDSVIGRINCLIVSIIVINWERAIGVEGGTRWLRKWFVFWEILKRVIANQNGSANENVNIICLVRV